MNAENILSKIYEEENIYINSFNDKSKFDNATKDTLDFTFPNEDSIVVFIALSFLSIMIFIPTFSFYINNFLNNAVLSVFTSFLSFSLFYFILIKVIFRKNINNKYKKREDNDVLRTFFLKYFLNESVSNEIHNMLKIYLTDDEYVNLKESNDKDIIYKDAISSLDAIIDKEKILMSKKEVFLSQEEIKKYNYQNHKIYAEESL